MLYRKKPVTIEAMQLDGTVQTAERIAVWCGGHIEHLTVSSAQADPVQLVIDTLEGRMFARRGDWIIKGVRGEFYPCKPDIFDATYEAVSA